MKTKKIAFVILPLLLLNVLPSCSKTKERKRPIVDNEVYDVDIPTRDVAIKEIKLLNVPTGNVEIGYLSYMGIEMSIEYVDGEKVNIPFSEKLLTEEHFDIIRTPGKKSIDFIFQGNHINFDVTLVEPEVPIYHKVSYYDHYNNLLSESYHRYLSKAVYNGPRVESYMEDDKYYEFNDKWDHDMDYVYCDFSTHAVYDQLDVRNYGFKYEEKYNVYDESQGKSVTIDSTAFVSYENPDGYLINNYVLYYLGELENVEILTGETFYHQQGDFDKVMGDVSTDDISLEKITNTIINKGYRVGEKEKTKGFPFYEYLAWIEDPLWLRVYPDKSYYGKPNGIAYDVKDFFPVKSYTRKDGRGVSFNSIIKDQTLNQIKDDLDEKNFQLYTSDKYPSGYYRVSYVVDVDLSLQTLLYGMADDYNYEMLLNPQGSELIPGYIPGSARAVLSYSPTGTFKEQKSNPICYDVDGLLSLFGMPA